MASLRLRHAREEGFTLVELLIVFVIIGILLAIAVASYLGFRERAIQKAASSDVRDAVPAAETYFTHNDTYAGMTLTSLRAIDTGVDIDAITISDGTVSPPGRRTASTRWLATRSRVPFVAPAPCRGRTEASARSSRALPVRLRPHCKQGS